MDRVSFEYCFELSGDKCMVDVYWMRNFLEVPGIGKAPVPLVYGNIFYSFYEECVTCHS